MDRSLKLALPLLLSVLFGAPSALASPEARIDKAKSSYEEAAKLAARGETDAGIAALQAAIDAGYREYWTLQFDPATASLRKSEAWPALIKDFRQRHPWTAVFDTEVEAPGFPWMPYAAASRLDADEGPSAAMRPTYLQMHSYLATMVGEYTEASELFLGGIKTQDASAAGIGALSPALEALPALVSDRRVVMLNEPHGHAHVRASNLMLVRELRKQGFTHLALEALSHEPAVGDDCRSSRISDAGLHARGHALAASGYYLNDPVFAELVRVALASGFTLVAYDFHPGSPLAAEREQAQAENLACVLRSNAEARLVVIGGGGHISELTDQQFPGGLMGARFKSLTGVDPLTITTRVTALTANSASALDDGYRRPASDGNRAGQPFLAMAADGRYLSSPGYDMVAYVPLIAGRGESASWMTLGGHRARVVVESATCPSTRLCLIEARRVGESAAAVPADRCVSRQPGHACALFLPPGQYEVTATTDQPAVVARVLHAQP